MFGLTSHLETEIKHPGRRAALRARFSEALGDGWAQAKLATDRLEAFMEEGLSPGGLVTRTIQFVRRRIGW